MLCFFGLTTCTYEFVYLVYIHVSLCVCVRANVRECFHVSFRVRMPVFLLHYVINSVCTYIEVLNARGSAKFLRVYARVISVFVFLLLLTILLIVARTKRTWYIYTYSYLDMYFRLTSTTVARASTWQYSFVCFVFFAFCLLS